MVHEASSSPNSASHPSGRGARSPRPERVCERLNPKLPDGQKRNTENAKQNME